MLQLTTSVQSIDFDAGDYDCGIQLGDGKWRALEAIPMLKNEIAPACTPAYARTLGSRPSPRALARATLLHSLGRPEDWERWLDAVGAHDLKLAHSLTYESSVFSYQAALEGQGNAIAQKALIDEELRAGRLVLPFKESLDMGALTFYFVAPKRGPERRETLLFRRWIGALAAQGGAAPRHGVERGRARR